MLKLSPSPSSSTAREMAPLARWMETPLIEPEQSMTKQTDLGSRGRSSRPKSG